MASPLAAGGHAEREPCLVVLDEADGVVATVSLSTSQATPFSVLWVHSVELEEWQEEFAVRPDGAIEIRSTRFRTFGAGTPDTAPQTAVEDGWIIMSGFARVVDPLVIRAAEITNHRLIFGTSEVPLAPGQYRFEVVEVCRGRQHQL